VIGYVAIRFFVMTNPAAAEMDVIDRLPPGQRIATAPHLFTYYIQQFLWPTPLCVIHDVKALSATGPAFYVSLSVAAGFVALWIGLALRAPWVWLAGLWVGATFAPVSNLHQIINLWAERYYYSVNLGTSAIAVAAIGAGWALLARRVAEQRRRVLAIAGWVLVGLLAWWAALCDLGRILECQTSLSFWRATVRHVPTHGNALVSLAIYELEAGNLSRAERLAHEAEQRGWVYQGNYILGIAAYRQKDWGQAIAHFENALNGVPASITHRTGLMETLARSYLKVGQPDRAAATLRRALDWDPRSPAAQKARNLLRQIEPKQADAPSTPSVGNETP